MVGGWLGGATWGVSYGRLVHGSGESLLDEIPSEGLREVWTPETDGMRIIQVENRSVGC